MAIRSFARPMLHALVVALILLPECRPVEAYERSFFDDTLYPLRQTLPHLHRDALDALRLEAENGKVEAQLRWGMRTYFGNLGPSQSMEKALVWLEKAAAQGSGEAAFFAAFMRLQAGGIPKDAAAAARMARLAAERGHPAAMALLGDMTADGDGMPADPPAALAWYRRGAEAGSAWAQYRLAEAYELGRGVVTDLPAAIRWYRRASLQELGRAQVALADLYASGASGPENRVLATKWYELAFRNGDGFTLRRLALAMEVGRCQPYDAHRVQTLFESAASQGDLEAKKILARKYMSGTGVPRDPKKARDLLRWDAQAGDAEAQAALGEVLALSSDADDLIEAYAWFQKAAYLNHPPKPEELEALERHLSKAQLGDAQYRLAKAFETGGQTGIQRSSVERLKWLRRAGENGQVEAMLALASIYAREPHVVPQNLPEAFRWYRAAAEAGHPRAMERMAGYHFWQRKDPAEGLRWYERAAAKDPYIMADLGRHYLHYLVPVPPGIPYDVEKGLGYLRTSAERGDKTGMHAYGSAMLTGRFGPQNTEEGARWLVKADEANAEYAAFDLGVAYAEGKHVARNENLAVNWFMRALRFRSSRTLERLAVLIEQGHGTASQRTDVLKKLLSSASSGSRQAQERLATWFEGGKVVPADPAVAVLFYRMTGASSASRTRLEGRYSAEQLEQARGRLRAFYRGQNLREPSRLP